MTPHILATATTAFIIVHKLLEKKKKQKTRRIWMKEIYKNRIEFGKQLYENFTDMIPNFTRMTKENFDELYSLIEHKIRKKDTFRLAITAQERLLITLRFLATGDSFTSLQYLFKISKQSISVIIPEVCNAIIDQLKGYVKLPSTTEEWLAVARDFETKWNFPHVIAAMDGKHVVLQSPINSHNDYDNYKLFPSIVLFALVDANYNFLYVDVGSKGRISDGGVFKNTNLYEKLERNELHIPPPEILQVPYSLKVPYYILGDKAFSLNLYTMKPYEGTPERGSKERIYNYRLSRARRVVENAFGILSSIFRVLRKPMLLEPEKARKVVLATIYLYNYIRSTRSSNHSRHHTASATVNFEDNDNTIPNMRHESQITSFLPLDSIPREETDVAKQIRSHLATHFITNAEIAWQRNYQ